MKDTIKDIEIILGYTFNDKSLIKRALIHKSYDNSINNEKLEFLGDRVLGLVISKKLLEIYPDEKEGSIDKKFANLVNKKTCSEISKILNIKKFMLLGRSQMNALKSTDKYLSDCLEAIIGSIYLDGSLKSAEKFILRFWSKYLEKSILTLVDAKTQLQEYSLKKFKILPKYTFYKKSGPQHKPTFKTDVQIPNSKKVVGIGASKKDAQQNAANKLLKVLKVI